jgi:uncharacterized FAD-dependent dehydrogenase
VVIGRPCGLLAALILAQMGFRPIIIERGKAVRERTKDTWGLWRRSVLTPDRTCSSAKAARARSPTASYSRIKDPRHLGRKVLTEFVKAGAPDDILTEAHPHIGTFRLVTMVMSIRETIEALGGEYRFQTRVEDFEIETAADGTRCLGLAPARRSCRPATSCWRWATARAIRSSVLHDRGVAVEAKPFAIGVRIEHPQSWIDKARYGPGAGNPILRGGLFDLAPVFQRPHGLQLLHVPRRTRRRRDERGRAGRHQRHEPVFARRIQRHSGIVVDISPDRDYPGGPLAGIAFSATGNRWPCRRRSNCWAPGQKLGDFLAGRPSTTFGEVTPSYQPGVHLTDLSQCLPDFVIE